MTVTGHRYSAAAEQLALYSAFSVRPCLCIYVQAEIRDGVLNNHASVSPALISASQPLKLPPLSRAGAPHVDTREKKTKTKKTKHFFF